MTHSQTALKFQQPALFLDGAPSQLVHKDDWNERELVAMLAAYRLCGGVVGGDQLAAILREHHPQPISVAARWLVRRSILSFSWRGQTLIPLFQFERTTMCARAGVVAVVRELRDAFNDWEMSLWFATPNSWLDNVCPVSVVCSEPQAVLRAAQADRYIALG